MTDHRGVARQRASEPRPPHHFGWRHERCRRVVQSSKQVPNLPRGLVRPRLGLRALTVDEPELLTPVCREATAHRTRRGVEAGSTQVHQQSDDGLALGLGRSQHHVARLTDVGLPSTLEWLFHVILHSTTISRPRPLRLRGFVGQGSVRLDTPRMRHGAQSCRRSAARSARAARPTRR